MRTIFLINICLWLTLLLMFTTMHLPGNTLFWRSLQNSGHGLALFFVAFFGITTIQLKSALPSFKILIAVAVSLLALSILIETIQYIIGRGASGDDLIMDIAGIIMGVCFSTLLWIKGRPWLKAGLVFLGTALLLFCIHLPAYYFTADRLTPQLPVITDFDGFLPSAKIEGYSADFYIKDYKSTWPSSTGKSLLTVYSPNRWPSIRIMETVKDWSNYKHFSFDVFNSEDTDVQLSIRVDYQATGQLNRSFMTARRIVPTGATRINISYEELAKEYRGSTPNFTQISGVMLFLSNPKNEIALYFDNLMLR